MAILLDLGNHQSGIHRERLEMKFKKLTEQEADELEALIDAAKERPMTFEELKRG